MIRQPFCALPWCGKTGKIDMHHVKPRSQGGNDDESNLVAICHECHMGHHRQKHIDFEVRNGEYYAMKNGRWKKLVVYNEHNQDFGAKSVDDVLGSLAADLRELKCTADQVDYYLSRELSEALKKLHGDRKALAEWIADNLDVSPRSVDSYLTKRIAYASLAAEAKDLGITNGYRFFILTQKGHVLRDLLDDFRTMGRSHFDTKYGLNKEPKDKHECPDCGAVHTIKEEG